MRKPVQLSNCPVNLESDACKIIIGDARQMNLSQFERYGIIIADPPWPYDNPKSHRPRLGGSGL